MEIALYLPSNLKSKSETIPAMKYYMQFQGHTVGPMSVAELANYPVTDQTPICAEGATEWRPLFTYPELMGLVNRANIEQREELSNKKILCGVMALLFGTFGIQYFILGKVSGGIYTILLSIITCGCWGIVTFIQGILMLCMSDSEFERKYIANPASFPLF